MGPFSLSRADQRPGRGTFGRTSNQIFSTCEKSSSTGVARPKVEWEVGELVRVKEGPFTDFNGAIEDVNYDKSKVRVSVTICGRATPVELDFAQVEKV